MQSLFGGGELELLGGGGGGGGDGGLKDDGCGSVAWRSSPLPPEDVYSASHFALITAYQDIKTRLVCLERENTSIKRKLKIYEIKVTHRTGPILQTHNRREELIIITRLQQEGY